MISSPDPSCTKPVSRPSSFKSALTPLNSTPQTSSKETSRPATPISGPDSHSTSLLGSRHNSDQSSTPTTSRTYDATYTSPRSIHVNETSPRSHTNSPRAQGTNPFIGRTSTPAIPRGQTTNLASPRGQTTNTDSPRRQTTNTDSPRGQTTNTDSPRGQTTNPRGQTTSPASPRSQNTNTDSPKGQTTNLASPRSQTTNPTSPRGEDTNLASPRGQTTNPASPKGQSTNQDSPRGQAKNPACPRGQITNTFSHIGQTANPNNPGRQKPDPTSSMRKTTDPSSLRGQTANPNTTNPTSHRDQTIEPTGPKGKNTILTCPAGQTTNPTSLRGQITSPHSPRVQNSKPLSDRNQASTPSSPRGQSTNPTGNRGQNSNPTSPRNQTLVQQYSRGHTTTLQHYKPRVEKLEPSQFSSSRSQGGNNPSSSHPPLENIISTSTPHTPPSSPARPPCPFSPLHSGGVPQVHINDGGETPSYPRKQGVASIASARKTSSSHGEASQPLQVADSRSIMEQGFQPYHSSSNQHNLHPFSGAEFADQFDMYLYQSQHISTPVLSPAAPQFLVELPSDSDSSRRQSRASDIYSFFENSPVDGAPIYLQPSADKPLVRCASFSGPLPLETNLQQESRSPSRPSFLNVPHTRTRGSSLPDNIAPAQLYRLRTFSVNGKKIVNKGDVYKSRSNTSINSLGSSVENVDCETSALNSAGSSLSGTQRSGSYLSGRSLVATPNLSRGSSCSNISPESNPNKVFRVLMLGSSGVGKSALCSQFMSSDHINTYIKIEDDIEKEVSLAVNGEESRILFIDHEAGDISAEDLVSKYQPHCILVVLAVDDLTSLEYADSILEYLKSSSSPTRDTAVILVANKSDLVRSRVVRTTDGKSLAVKYEVKYIETAPGINHNVDELLVGAYRQISLRHQAEQANLTQGRGSKMLGLLGKMYDWGVPTSRAKSCSNLNTL